MAEDESDRVRYSVARNSTTPIHILQKLVADSEDFVRKTAFEQLCENYIFIPSPTFIRLLVFLNPHAPVSLLIKYYRSTSWLERYAVASNPSTPVRILYCLSKDVNRVVRAAAKANFEYSYKIHP